MKKFPITIVDNFYETPNLVRNFALSCDWTKTDGAWPGQRTQQLSVIDSDFFNLFSSKLISLFYDFDKSAVEWSIDTSFQKVSCFSSKKGDIKNDGWIHADNCIFSGVIYLNPNPKPGWGTSIYSLKPGEEKELQQELKFDHYLGKEIDEKEYELQKRNNNDKFVETVRINNVYNRLILFEGGEYHGVPTFYSDESEERLTQVFFVNALNSQDPYPIVRSKLRY